MSSVRPNFYVLLSRKCACTQRTCCDSAQLLAVTSSRVGTGSPAVQYVRYQDPGVFMLTVRALTVDLSGGGVWFDEKLHSFFADSSAVNTLGKF